MQALLFSLIESQPYFSSGTDAACRKWNGTAESARTEFTRLTALKQATISSPAATGSGKKLAAICREYQEDHAANLFAVLAVIAAKPLLRDRIQADARKKMDELETAKAERIKGLTAAVAAGTVSPGRYRLEVIDEKVKALNTEKMACIQVENAAGQLTPEENQIGDWCRAELKRITEKLLA